MGFATRGERFVKELGEKGHEVQCGQGAILFFQPLNKKGSLLPLVTKKGFGPFGLSGLGNGRSEGRAAGCSTGVLNVKFVIQQTENRKSFVVPEELAAGSFIEFVQQ